MYCKFCGKQVSDDAKFCDGCGKKLTEDTAPVTAPEKKEVHRCPNCGETVNQYAQACKYCGQDLASKSDKKKKKKPMGCLVWVIVIIFALGSCSVILGGSSEDPAPETTPVTTETIGTITEIAETDATPTTVSLETAVSAAEALIKEHFENCTVSYDETGFTVTISVDGISLIGSLAAGGNEDMKETWDNVVTSTVSMSESMTQYFRECGFDDLIVSMNVVNDQNPDNIVIMTMNGVLVYDAVEDGE